jgi:hypothetical protein
VINAAKYQDTKSTHKNQQLFCLPITNVMRKKSEKFPFIVGSKQEYKMSRNKPTYGGKRPLQ